MSDDFVRKRRGRTVPCEKLLPGSWPDTELADCHFKDQRLGKRFKSLIGQLSSSPGGTIPLACQDWANTKAAYRFLDNGRVSEVEILAGHFQATRDRVAATDGPILVLHDTTEFTYKRDDIEAIGRTKVGVAGVDRDGRPRLYTACGILMHSSLAVTTNGLPLGLTAIKFWSREKFKGTNALKRRINPTRVPIEEKESIRWLDNLRRSTALLERPACCVHIGDRESDIYELFCTAKDIGTHFLLRTCVDRLAGDGSHTIAAEMAETHCKGLHRVDVRDRHGELSRATLELTYRRIRVLPPIGKQSRYPSLVLTVLHARERRKPPGRDRIDWKLVTDLQITSRSQAVEKLCWYAQRWKIETYHKILKSGCRAEQSKLRTAERIVNLLAMFCILGWRIFWMTMLNRCTRHLNPTLVFTAVEVALLEQLAPEPPGRDPPRKPSLNSSLTQLARLGGYLNRAGDMPPGNTVMWRGLSRLSDIEIGYLLGSQQRGSMG
jgi:Transposase DNA-binding/Transposase Tn5 dimerisation domain